MSPQTLKYLCLPLGASVILLAAGFAVVPAAPSQATTTYTLEATVPTGLNPWDVTVSPAGDKVLVTDYTDNALRVFDASTLTSTTITVGSFPGFVDVTPDGTTAYTTDFGSNTVSIVDLGTSTRTGFITGFTNPWAMTIHGDDSLFVYDLVGTNAPISRVNLRTGLIDDSVALPASYAWSATISADGQTIYSAHPPAQKFFAVRTSDMSIVANVTTVGQPRYTAVSPDGNYVYLTSTVTVDETTGPSTLQRFNTQTLSIDNSWELTPNSATATGVAISPDGQTLYVALDYSGGTPGQLVMVDAATGQIDDSLTIGSEPLSVAISPSGDRVYVVDYTDYTLSVISVNTPTPPTPQPPVPAGAPLDVRAQAGARSAEVSWAPPASTGSFPVSHYQAVASPAGGSCLVVVTANSCSLTRLSDDQEYSIRVRALTGAGWGAWSDPVSVMPSPKRSILITGSREGRVITVDGSSSGLGMGAILRPWVRVSGRSTFTEGSARILVSVDGTFEWSRRAARGVAVFVATPDGEVRSNRVIIPAR